MFYHLKSIMYSIHISKAKYRNTYNVQMHLPKKKLEKNTQETKKLINLKQAGYYDVYKRLTQEAPSSKPGRLDTKSEVT